MHRTSRDVRARPRPGAAEPRRSVPIGAVVALNVVAYSTLAAVSVAWYPDYRAVLVMLVALLAHRSAYLSSRGP